MDGYHQFKSCIASGERVISLSKLPLYLILVHQFYPSRANDNAIARTLLRTIKLAVNVPNARSTSRIDGRGFANNSWHICFIFCALSAVKDICISNELSRSLTNGRVSRVKSRGSWVKSRGFSCKKAPNRVFY
jgi:hypothetical protein